MPAGPESARVEFFWLVAVTDGRRTGSAKSFQQGPVAAPDFWTDLTLFFDGEDCPPGPVHCRVFVEKFKFHRPLERFWTGCSDLAVHDVMVNNSADQTNTHQPAASVLFRVKGHYSIPIVWHSIFDELLTALYVQLRSHIPWGVRDNGREAGQRFVHCAAPK